MPTLNAFARCGSSIVDFGLWIADFGDLPDFRNLRDRKRADDVEPDTRLAFAGRNLTILSFNLQFPIRNPQLRKAHRSLRSPWLPGPHRQ
jgi:hypothetical protein